MTDYAQLDHLVTADNTRPPAVRGQWFPIHLVPDLGSDERINIGVGFIDSQGRLHSRFVATPRGLAALYGRAAARNFQFLLALAADYIQNGGTNIDALSPHIRIGTARFASGESVVKIIDGLFDTAVSLAWEDERERRDAPHSRDTEGLRRAVFGSLRRKHSDWYDRAIHEQPIILKTDHGQTITADLPIWLAEGELFSRPKFGTVVSAWFASEAYRGYSLLTAYRDLTMALRWGKFGKNEPMGAAFILKPPRGGRFDLRQTNAIEQDVERLTVTLQETGIETIVRDDSQRLTDAVIEYIGTQ
jgi:hypothetical protein